MGELRGPVSASSEAKQEKESEISRELKFQDQIIEEACAMFNRLVDKIGPVLRTSENGKEASVPENIVMTGVGKRLSDNNKKLIELIDGMKSIRNRVEL